MLRHFMPSHRSKKRTTTLEGRAAHKKPHPGRVYIQTLSPWAFRPPSVACTASTRTSTQAKMAKTPREHPRPCLWKVRVGRDGKSLYYSVMTRRKNPHYKGTYTGHGWHYSFTWKKVYDRTTDKPVDISTAPYLVARLS